MRKTYYQPVIRIEADVPRLEYPKGFVKGTAFESSEDCEYWMNHNGYENKNYSILGFTNEYTSNLTIINKYGEVVEIKVK